MAKNVIKPHSKKKLKILLVATEAAPYATVGGFSSVVSYLSRELASLGHDVRIFIPKFGFIDETKYKMKVLVKDLAVPTGDDSVPELFCNVKVLDNPDNPVITYFLENQEYYEKRANVYGYSDDPTRWALLSRGVLEFIKTEMFVPDVIHCNDWHTGIIPNYIKTVYGSNHMFDKMCSIFTIHNLSFQGMFDHKHVSELDFDDGKSEIASFFSPRLTKQNFMRRGILYSDAVNTVSKTYSREILTPEFGEGLDKLLLELRGKVFGIINGIDYSEFDSSKDALIEKNYDIDTLDDRLANKTALQKEFDLPVNPDIPLIGFVGRLDYMKGVDLIVKVMQNLLNNFNVQFVQVGGGDGGLAEMLRGLKSSFPDKVGIHPYPNFTLPRLIFSGADCVLYPSRFEPCGIVQLESMRYGAIPVVRRVGGLADTVEGFDVKTLKGTGFVFDDFNEFALYGQCVRALELYQNKQAWRQLQVNAMSSDFSWKSSAKEYEKLYDKAIIFRSNRNPREKEPYMPPSN